MAPKQRATPRRTKDEVYELNATAMGEILGRFRGGKSTHPLTAYTVMRYVHNNAGDIPNFPQPDRLDGQRSTWRSTRIPEIEEWARNRPGRGAGGGPPWPDPPTLDEGYVPCARASTLSSATTSRAAIPVTASSAPARPGPGPRRRSAVPASPPASRSATPSKGARYEQRDRPTARG
jgi:hypothetical protein